MAESELASTKIVLTPAEIGERIWLAIAERRLRPGTRLKEEELAEIFSVSRARIRQALTVLEREGLVTILPNRGAFVSAPTVEEAADVLFARKMIEQRVVARLAAQIDENAISELRRHVTQEREAASTGAVSDVIRLSGGFHQKLAEMLGSEFLNSILRDLIARSSLITAVYRDTAHFNCGPDEHTAIIDCLERSDSAGVTVAMGQHLDHIESDLQLDRHRQIEPDLKSVLG